MKIISNWISATVFDIESDGFLDVATKMHVLSYQMQGKDVSSFHGQAQADRIKALFMWHIKNSVPVVVHNGISFDIPLAEKLLDIDLSDLMVIDSLALSWYLNPSRRLHGLDSFHEDYGIAKPKVSDWNDQPYEVYENRCVEDVKINKALWEDLKSRLIDMYTRAQVEIDSGNVGGKRLFEGEEIYLDQFIGSSVEDAISRILSFLMFKMDCARLQEKTQWEVNVPALEESRDKLSMIVEEAKNKLESVMPKVPKYSTKKMPVSTMYKKDGELSVSGRSWQDSYTKLQCKTRDEFGTLLAIDGTKENELRILKGYEDPKSSSPQQIKDFLYSKGWVPETFKYEKDEPAFNAWIASKPKEGSNQKSWSLWKSSKPKERAIPQVTKAGEDGKEMCPSVERLSEEFPEIMLYAEYNVAKHRLGILDGFLRDKRDGKWLQARIGGFTNTLRVQHRELVNLPGVDKAFGMDVRGCLVAGDGMVLLGTDMSSLEDRVKHHFMLPHDPNYVATMQASDFDPHILMALIAKMITQEEFDAYKADPKGKHPAHVKKARKDGKTTNYASVYNAGAAKIAQAAGVSVKEGGVLHSAYWELNWSVKAIADEQVVIKDASGTSWLINPVNGFLYALRKDSDRFSTLAQGTGSFFFDMWVDNAIEQMKSKYNKTTLTGSFHDEMVMCIRDNERFRKEFQDIVNGSIDTVNQRYKLRRLLGCETQFGKRYADIH